MKVRWRHAREAWCRNCKREIDDMSLCPYCGGTYLNHQVDPFASVKEAWIDEPVVWWRPSTWFGGKWVPCE